MSSLTIRPITLVDLWSFLAEKKRSPVSRANYRAVAREVAGGRVVGAFSSDHRIVGIGAVTQVSNGNPPIAWLSVDDGGFGRFGVSAVKAIRAELAKAGASIALVDEANGNGQRLARLVGLEATDDVHLGMRVWRGRDHRQNRQTSGVDR